MRGRSLLSNRSKFVRGERNEGAKKEEEEEGIAPGGEGRDQGAGAGGAEGERLQPRDLQRLPRHGARHRQRGDPDRLRP